MDVQGKGATLATRVGWLAIVLGLLIAPALTAPGAAEARVRSEFFGIVQGNSLDARDLSGLTEARVRADRFMLNWGWVQPKDRASFNWAGTDRLIGSLAAHGVRALPALWGNPGWVYGSPARPPIERPADVQAWRGFLQAAVARYGRGGTFWTTRYRQLYGPKAAPLPITSWQVWNEPNLKKYFAPYPSPGKYARLLQISYPAIKSRDRHAQVALAGMPGFGDTTAWGFLGSLYGVPGIRGYFDAVALHPYGSSLKQVATEIKRVREAMRTRGDATTPLWIDEVAWGSAPRDSFGINKGAAGQAQMLRGSFKLVLDHRAAWNIQHLFWYHWRDPRRTLATCSFCSSAGLLSFDRVAKPALEAFRGFSAETTPPKASIHWGPREGALINDATPSFRFASNEPGSTFQCRFDARAFAPCSSPLNRLAALSNGTHAFQVRAIDAAGNESVAASRTFTVDTIPPPVPTITGTDPVSPANANAPKVKGAAAPGATVKLFETPACSGAPVATGSAAQFASPGLTVSVPDNSTTSLRATATDAAGNVSGCSAAFTYVEASAT